MSWIYVQVVGEKEESEEDFCFSPSALKMAQKQAQHHERVTLAQLCPVFRIP